jgi:hypothetical protein
MLRRQKGQNTYPRPRPATYEAGAGIERNASLFLSDDMAHWLEMGILCGRVSYVRRVHSKGGISRAPIFEASVVTCSHHLYTLHFTPLSPTDGRRPYRCRRSRPQHSGCPRSLEGSCGCSIYTSYHWPPTKNRDSTCSKTELPRVFRQW